MTILLIGLLLCLDITLFAQQAELTADSQAVSPGKEPSDLSIEEIEARSARILESSDLSDDVRGKIQSYATKSAENIRNIQEWLRKGAEFEKIKSVAASLIESIRAELSRPKDTSVASAGIAITLAEAEQSAAKSDAELKLSKQRIEEIEKDLSALPARRVELPKLQADSREKLETLNLQLASFKMNGALSDSEILERTFYLSQERLLKAELAAYDAELSSFDQRSDLLRAQRDQLTRRMNELDESVKFYQNLVNDRRRREAEDEAQKALDTLMNATSSAPEILALAQENAGFADLRKKLAERLEAETDQIQRKTSELAKIRDDFKSIQEKIKASGFSDTIGMILRMKRSEIASPRLFTFSHERSLERRRERIAEVQLAMIDIDEKLASMADMESVVGGILSGLDPEMPEDHRTRVTTNIRELLDGRKKLLEGLLSDYTACFTRLADHDLLERQLVSLSAQYTQFIDERILWIRSCKPLGIYDIPRALRGLGYAFSPEGWFRVVREFGSVVYNGFGTAIFVLFIFSAWYFFRKSLPQRLELLAESCFKAVNDKFSHTLKALAFTVIVSAFWPAAVYMVSLALSSGVESGEFVKSVAVALMQVVPFFFGLKLLKNIFLDRGLALAHFNWRFEEGFMIIRQRLKKMMTLSLPLFFFHILLSQNATDLVRDSLGRLFFMAALFMISYTLHPLVSPSGEFISGLSKASNSRLIFKLRYVLYFLTVVVPIGMALTAGFGYFYTAEKLFLRVAYSQAFLWAVFLTYSLIYRALFVQRRRLALQMAMEKLAGGSRKDEPELVKEHQVQGFRELDISTLSKQTLSLLSSICTIVIIVGLWVIWAEVLPAIKILNRIPLWNTSQKVYETVRAPDGTASGQMTEKIVSVSLSDFLLAVVIVVLTITGNKNIPGFLEFSLLQRLPMDAGMRYAARTLTSYLLTVVGFVAAFHVIGIGWDKVQWLVAAVSVGLGFGLQEIFANFVSGLIILFERPMRVGDVVTVGDISGTVSKIEIRATTIIAWDRRELIVPNREFITGKLINWTLSDTIQRMVFKVRVAYGSDVDAVQRILERTAENNPLVMKEPRPKAIFLSFGASSLDFELRLFIPSLDNMVDLTHQVYADIYKSLNEHKIEIPFPQRDVHIRSIAQSQPVAVINPADHG